MNHHKRSYLETNLFTNVFLKRSVFILCLWQPLCLGLIDLLSWKADLQVLVITPFNFSQNLFILFVQ